VVAIADPVRGVPKRVKLAQARNHKTQSQLPQDVFQQAIELSQGRHVSCEARACNRAAALHGSGFSPTCSAFFVTADTTVEQRRSLKFISYLSLDSVIADWEAARLSLNC
jgi:hypothetical protein